MYYLLAHSSEVEQYEPLVPPTFSNGTAHASAEQWFKNLHDYQHSVTLSEDKWSTYQTEKSIQALQGTKLVIFRCHPNSAYKLNFIKNLKVVYMTADNPLQFERWIYEKEFKSRGEEHFQTAFKNFFKTDKCPGKISNILKRQFLINNINHDLKSFDECREIYKDNIFRIAIEKLLNKDYLHYVDVCKFLNISPMAEEQFATIIEQYNSKQWKRF
jgi:hypothetical protein